MQGSLIDRLACSGPLPAKIIRGRIKRFFTLGAASNMLCCAAASLAAGLLYEAGGTLYYPAFTVMLIVWAEAAVLGGFRGQWLFMFFDAAYWLLPRLFISAADSATQTMELAALNKALADVSITAAREPLALIDELLSPIGIGGFADLICTAAFLLLYYFGHRARKAAKRSDFYCVTRLEQLEKLT